MIWEFCLIASTIDTIMGLQKLRKIREAAVLKADETHNEETTAWCNRDLIPLPPSRRTWGWFNFFGAGSL